MTELRPTVELDTDAFYRALQHGVELWNDGSTPTFRLDRRGGRDGFTRYVNARIEGKLAEEAFVAFLDEHYGIEAGVDYDIYGSIETTDDGDIKYIVDDNGNKCFPPVGIEIKMTKPWNDWLAIRAGAYDRIPDDAPVVLVRLALEDDLVLDAWEDESWASMDNDPMFSVRAASFAHTRFPVEAELTGVVYKDEFTHEFEQGDRLFDPDTGDPVGGPLRRDNVAIPCDDLISTQERWDEVVTLLTEGVNVDPLP